MIKKKPDGWKSVAKDASGDADQFFIDLAASVSDERTANIIATALLIDYIFFDGGDPVSCNLIRRACKVNWCTCYCCGCLCPCKCKFDCGGDDDDEAEEESETDE